MTIPSPSAERSSLLRYILALGPALIVASVVLGPGSILTSSKVGAEYGYHMVWVLVLAALLMAGMTALGATVGVSLKRSPGDELAARLGRPVAAMVGGCVFLICACFQFSNNLGVLAAGEPLLALLELTQQTGLMIQNLILLLLNGLVIAALYGMKKLYRPVEKLMMLLVGAMLVGFATNLVLAQPNLLELAAGLLPQLPATESTAVEGVLNDALLPVLGLVATTFSIAGAYYQAYLVREKGWNVTQLKQGLVDSLAGITVLGGITLMIMVTAAAVLHGRVEAAQLTSVADVAYQLRPLFGDWATALFCLGIFAGAFSSFLMNAMIGGGMLADGLGLGSTMDSRFSKLFTMAAMLIGMVIASAMTLVGREGFVPLIVLAQAITVVGLPPLAIALLYLLHCGEDISPKWRHMLTMAGVLGLLVALILAARTVWLLVSKM